MAAFNLKELGEMLKELAMKKPKTINQLKEELEKSKYKPPRAGVHPTKVIPDKRKYDRKRDKKDHERTEK